MNDYAHRLIVTVTVALLALIIMGGAVAGWLLGKEIPEWLTVLVGSIGTGAFLTSGFFALARSSEQAMAALAESRSNHHVLAMAVASRLTGPGITEAAPVTTEGDAS